MEFHRLARKDLHEARTWYKARSTDAARRFADRLDEALGRIESDPLSFAILPGRYRYVRLQKFPYHVVYRVDEGGEVVIVAVAHNRRRPGYWRRRT